MWETLLFCIVLIFVIWLILRYFGYSPFLSPLLVEELETGIVYEETYDALEFKDGKVQTVKRRKLSTMGTETGKTYTVYETPTTRGEYLVSW